MIRSMTGFGDVSQQVNGVHYAVELRSLNNRYFKARIHLPEEIAGLEPVLDSQLHHRLSRGSVTLTVKMWGSGAAAAHQINDGALLAYLEHMKRLHARLSTVGKSVNIDVTSLLSLPGVLQPLKDEGSVLDSARPVVAGLINQACDKVLSMRVAEGRTIAGDLTKHLGVIRQQLDLIAQRTPLVCQEYHQRLRIRIDEMMARAELRVDEKDLIREVAVFAERADISEEVNRMTGHLEQFNQVTDLPDGEPAGRTLDFLTQELLREANTIASKCNDGQITHAVVLVKGAIDRIKEQVQNVE